MKNKATCIGAAILLSLAMSLVQIASVRAQAGGEYELVRWTIDSGGGVSAGGVYVVDASIGQPEAEAMTGGDYTVVSGYEPGLAQYRIYLPLIVRQS